MHRNRHLSRRTFASSAAAAVVSALTPSDSSISRLQGGVPQRARGWRDIRSFKMAGDLRAFWDVHPAAVDRHEALRRGFQSVDLLGTYADYPGKQKRSISNYLRTHRVNPWRKPAYFEEIIKRNILSGGGKGAIFVHDIEFGFEQHIERAWADPATRRDSGAKSLDEFRNAYLREWATWFSLPCRWSKQFRPKQPVGLYGPQPFRRDYWGLAGKTARQIDGTHALDVELWKHIDPFVDFYIASIYVFYDNPGSIYYMASNVEENYKRTRRYGNKPVYAYDWLRYHDSNKKLKGQELAPWLVEASAVIPYFCGAKGVVLWGWEPKATGQPYERLPLFVNSLGRVADLSEKIARAKPILDPPAHVTWRKKQPLIRRLKVSDDEWIVLATNPWQTFGAESRVTARCGSRRFALTLRGRHSDIFHMVKSHVERFSVV